ncbi:MAG TPA: hypothetical protein VGP07_22010 [Polyangia bacterium]|jgi:hypothetical protein
MSSECPCDDLPTGALNIPAGLSSLPRQIRSFSEVREALLRSLPGQPALAAWRARGAGDLGVMWLEMWAYVSDVLNFYDERIANESYLRTAQLDPSLRRLVALIGARPRPAVAGAVSLAALAEGRTAVTIPARTAFRSGAFGTQPPQVFELTVDTPIHPLKNQWQLGPIRKGTLPEITPSVAADPAGTATSPAGQARFVVFRPDDFGLARDRIVLFQIANQPPPGLVSRVKNTTSFTGVDGLSYVEVELDPPVDIPPGTDPGNVRALLPTVTASPTKTSTSGLSDVSPASPVEDANQRSAIFLDAVYRQLHLNDPVVVTRAGHDPSTSVQAFLVTDTETVLIDGPTASPRIKVPVTRVEVDGVVARSSVAELGMQFGFVNAGTVTTVGSRTLTESDLTAEAGVPVQGIVETPPGTPGPGGSTLLNQQFLLQDANRVGARVSGTMRFDGTGRATFRVEETFEGAITTLTTPVTVFGNVFAATRGESLIGEVLGSGDPRQANQSFTLKKSPLTYLTSPAQQFPVSTLSIEVDGVFWTEVPTFFGTGPQDQVFIVRQTPAGDSTVTFGDGTSGARLPSGTGNVIASYRFGAGQASPPAGSVEQIARPADGLRAVRSPLPAVIGADADTPRSMRTSAPQTALVLKRLVSVADYQAIANQRPGVIKAVASFIYLDDQQRAGVRVDYIGTAPAGDLEALFTTLGDPDLPVQVVPALSAPRTLQLTVGIQPRADGSVVSAAVVQTLSDPTTGFLAPANLDIGGQLWVSQLFAAVLGVPNVVEVQSATLIDELGNATSLAAASVVCAPAGTFFDFGGGQGIAVATAAPLGGLASPPNSGGTT